MTRRDFLRFCAYSTTALAVGGLSGCMGRMPMSSGMHGNRSTTSSERQATVPASRPADTNFMPDIEIRMRAFEDTKQILSGEETSVWRYDGEVVKGEASILRPVENSYLGPTLHLEKGQRVRIHFRNELPVESNIHWHGLLVPERMDGHPRDIVQSGETYIYEFEVQNRAGTYWYHPHPHGQTGIQVYQGLAGLLIISDDDEHKLDLPRGEFDIGMVIQDRLFDEENQFVYHGRTGDQGLMGGMMGGNMHTQMMGMTGDHILVNGQPNLAFPVQKQAYRIRLLNGSNSRVYLLRWNNDLPLHVIGTDGGLLAETLERPYVILGPGERVELWVDFSRWGADEQPLMMSYPLGGGNAFSVFRMPISSTEAATETMPTQLVPMERLSTRDAVNAENPRQIALTMGRMQWTLNGRTFEMEGVAEDEIVQFNSTEIWEFNNDSAGMGMMGGGMSLPHPMHIHGVQFQVVERLVASEQEASWASLRQGYVDTGWKDTVLVMPGERVRVIMRFDAYPGLFLTHCHNLEHEDMSMMRNFLIEAS